MLEQMIFTEQPHDELLTPEDTEKDIDKTLKGISFMEDVRVIIKTKEEQQLSVDGKKCGPLERENDMYPRNETIKIRVENGQTIVLLRAKHPDNYTILIKNPESITIYDKSMSIIRGYSHTTNGNFTLIQ
ncbi:MAG: hypothetical protein ACYDAS_04390 [Patescibacteria group bacterium]